MASTATAASALATGLPGVVSLLGGRAAFRKRPKSAIELHTHILGGLPYAALEAVMTTLNLERAEVCAALGLSARTFSRRKNERRLSPDESDRLFRLARIAARAAEVLGDTRKAAAWLQRPNRALGGEVPLRLVRSDLGSRQVEQIIGRIEHGIVS